MKWALTSPLFEFVNNICLLITWGTTVLFMVHLIFYAISLLIYGIMNDITTIP